MVRGKVMQIVWKGQGGGGRKCVRPGWKGGAYKPEPGASDSEGVEKASAADSVAWAKDAAWTQTCRAWFLCSGHRREEENGEKFFGNVSLLEGCMSEW